MTCPSSFETNWSVSHGSLDSTVSFESFDYPIESPESTRPKPPLLLSPPSPSPSSSDFEPCEIKLNFTQKHEIRQVYIRSTARVYEIYYAPSLQSDNEYLCTVRCSAASLEDNETISENSEGPNDILPKSRVADENKICNNEDDWVEVKLPVGQPDKGNTYLPTQTSKNIINHQDYYEATAEIDDSEPCMSLTLRLLSLKTKGCVYVDEVYVFADCIDTDDSVGPTVNTESSASSLMNMLVPTLLGVTKSRSAQLHNQTSPHVEKLSQTVSEPTTSNNRFHLVNQQDEKFVKETESKAALTRSQFSVPVPVPEEDKVCDSTMRNDISSNRTEVLLEQLVSRVSRIEDMFMRFEENMLKPVNNMQARLERVEQQVDLLAKNSQFSGSYSCPTLETNQINYSQLCVESESEKTESFSSETYKPPEDSVLESPCCDEKDEENSVVESPKNVTPKKTISIDDALSAALAGFSSFAKSNESPTPVPLESPEEDCTKGTGVSIDTPLGSSCESEASASTSCDVYKENPDDIFRTEGTFEVADEEDVGPSDSLNHDRYITDAQLVMQDTNKAVDMLTFDTTDVLKYFPDESETILDFESPILEVKFASLENGCLGSNLEALLSNSDDCVTSEGVLVTPQSNEEATSGDNLLVDFDGDDVVEELQQQDLVGVTQEISFPSLI
ncbi:uncharacterized protein [Rutidosis leptorrhynchoides]|uniref:uncharacterized protein n=1 Tax=Rutidosis leptorrhynchoides TaxID=125765 RepID=UPI003A997419